MRRLIPQKILCGTFLLFIFLLPFSGHGQNASNPLVMFNTQSYKYHNPSCPWAQRCTRNCILIPKSDAIHRGGVACKVCGGEDGK